ncbi:MAG: hypothetical protein KAX37_09015 [Opitutaceae bacterium]|nr:hypothetical protein [Opitutaceae bacterium]
MHWPSAGPLTGLSGIKFLFLILATATLWLAGVHLPGPPVAGLESWHAVLVDAHLQKRHFGSEIAFTYGPWGFLSLSGYQVEALGIKFRWEIIGKLLLACTLVVAASEFQGARRWLLIGLLVIGAPFFDNTASVTIAFLGLVWLLPADVPWWKRLVALLWLGFLSHFKFVFCMQALCCVTISCILHSWDKRWRVALSLFFGYTVVFLSAWLAAGQRTSDLPEYIRLSLEISQGYGWAMAVEPSGPVAMIAAWVIVHCALLTIAIVRSGGSPSLRAGMIVLAVTQWFIAWKQGFTRADDHVFGFYFFCLFFGVILTLVIATPRRAWRHDLSIVACLVGIALTNPVLATYGPRTAWTRITRFPHELTHLDAWKARFVAASASASNESAVAGLAAMVGSSDVDLFTYEQGILLLNHLKYRPRPIFQSYTAYTRALLEKNAAFYASSDAPECVMLRLKAIDKRYPGQEDSLALLEVARRYNVVDVTPAHALLRRKVPDAPTSRAIEGKVLIGTSHPAFGETFSVPQAIGQAIWMEVDLRPTFFGRLNAFLYHAYQPQMVATRSDRSDVRYRLISTQCSSGFLVRPFIESHLNFADLTKGRDRSSVTELRIELDSSGDQALWEKPVVRFYSLPSLRLATQPDGTSS